MQTKGTAVRSMLLALERVATEEEVERVRAAIPPAIRELMEPVVLASRSYPVDVSAALQDAIRTQLGGGSCAINHRVGIEAARIDFGGVYRVFLRVADYETTLRGMDRAWRQYNSKGHVTLSEVRPGAARIEVTGVEGFTEAMWHSIAGRVEGVLGLAGSKSARASVGAWSATGCVCDVRWTG